MKQNLVCLGGTVINLDEVALIVDRIVWLRDGKFVCIPKADADALRDMLRRGRPAAKRQPKKEKPAK